MFSVIPGDARISSWKPKGAEQTFPPIKSHVAVNLAVSEKYGLSESI